ncbi:MAG: HlyD family secretion protein, partial [Planctomycetota bacterium]
MRSVMCFSLAMLLANGCSESGASRDATEDHAPQPPSNRIAIPTPVRQNLGITFAVAERRVVERTIRVPGRFELRPRARREYRTMLPGLVELGVDQYQRVRAGDLLYRLDSPSWREMQQQLTDLDARIQRLSVKKQTIPPLMAAHKRHEESLNRTLLLWRERVEQLEAVREAGGGRASELAAARTSLSTAEAELADAEEKDAQLQASRAETEADLASARAQREFLLTTAASLQSSTVDTLIAPTASGVARWAVINRLEVRAAEDGVVERLDLATGGWADEKTLVLSTAQPDQLRFHAKGLQSDLGL